jgi:hypothetical protein
MKPIPYPHYGDFGLRGIPVAIMPMLVLALIGAAVVAQILVCRELKPKVSLQL